MKKVRSPWIKFLANRFPSLLPKFNRVSYTKRAVEIQLSESTAKIDYSHLSCVNVNGDMITFRLVNGVVKRLMSGSDSLLVDFPCDVI